MENDFRNILNISFKCFKHTPLTDCEINSVLVVFSPPPKKKICK